MVVGGLTVLLWIYIPHGLKEVYEIIPGFILSFLTIILVSKMGSPVSKNIESDFDKVDQLYKDYKKSSKK